MEVIKIASIVGKWSKSNDNTTGKLIESDKPGLMLKPYNSIDKSLFAISNNIYITNIETDFILDIDIKTVVQFDVAGFIPTVNDLYEAYLRVKENEEATIEKAKDELGDIWFRLKVGGTRKPYFRPFEKISNELNEVIRIAYPAN